MKYSKLNILAALAIGGLFSQFAQAGNVSYNLTGNVEHDGWDRLNSGTPGLSTTVLTTVPGFGSNEAGSGDANVLRLAGGHFPSSQSLYSFSSSSTFQIADTSALSDVQTVVFTLETWHNGGDGASPSGAVNSGPTLNYNGGNQALAPTYLGSLPQSTIDFGGPVTTYAHTWQWDLSGIGDAITSYNFTWEQNVHSGVIALQVASADQFSVAVDPKPQLHLQKDGNQVTLSAWGYPLVSSDGNWVLYSSGNLDQWTRVGAPTNSNTWVVDVTGETEQFFRLVFEETSPAAGQSARVLTDADTPVTEPR